MWYVGNSLIMINILTECDFEDYIFKETTYNTIWLNTLYAQGRNPSLFIFLVINNYISFI